MYEIYGRANPYEGEHPRQVLRKVCDLFAAEGLQPIVAPELEFYFCLLYTSDAADE